MTSGVSETVTPFVFESYGVTVRLVSNLQKMVDRAASVSRGSLLDELHTIGRKRVDLEFELNKHGRNYILLQNGKEIARGTSSLKFFKFFDGVIRASIGEYAKEHVFVHAGVVGWKGSAIVMPADSYKGKSTIVAELVKQGATYFSDDFAIFDQEGLVHAFPRPLSMRTEDHRQYRMTVESLGGVTAVGSLPVGLILFTGYEAGAKWDPRLITAGKGALDLIPFTLTFRERPELSLRVLNNVASRAIIAVSPRGNAAEFARLILNFVDKNVN
jgi:hypothetical protein